MTTRTLLALRAAVLATSLFSAATAGSSSAATPGPNRTAKIQYLADGSVYVDAGQRDGLREGDTLRVEREGSPIARLRVTYLSSRRAACDTLEVREPIRLGDLVRFVAHPDTAATAPEPDRAAADTIAVAPLGAELVSTPPPAQPAAARSRSRFRGRAGARLIAVQSGSTDGTDYLQPALDLRLDGLDAWDGRLDLAADLRGRHTTRHRAGAATETESSTRVYRFSASLHERGGGRRLTLGRQSSPALSGISLFDGALIEQRGARWSLGLFGGTQPAPVALGFSSDVLEQGVYLERHTPPGSRRRWSTGGGFVSSLQNGTLNRNFAFIQGLYLDRRGSVSLTQEVDVNGGWKRELGESALSPTSTFLAARAEVVKSVALRAGYDNRRSVRLYRDRLTPETDFDDSYRQGAWGGVTLEGWDHARLDGEARLHHHGADHARALSANAEVNRVTALHAAARVRYSDFQSDRTRSRLFSLSAGCDPTVWSHVEIAGGVRTTTDRLGGEQDRTPWQSLDVDASLSQRLYLTLSLERSWGDLEDVRQEYLGASWRF